MSNQVNKEDNRARIFGWYTGGFANIALNNAQMTDRVSISPVKMYELEGGFNVELNRVLYNHAQAESFIENTEKEPELFVCYTTNGVTRKELFPVYKPKPCLILEQDIIEIQYTSNGHTKTQQFHVKSDLIETIEKKIEEITGKKIAKQTTVDKRLLTYEF